jgi:streptogramin lyase
VPNSVVRLDADTGKPKQVIPVGASPDLIVASGGYVWVTHYIKRDLRGARSLRNGGDRTLTRVDPKTGEAVVVGGGLAPCGLTADPSGDVWVANCYASGGVDSSNVVRVDADTLGFKKPFPLPPTKNYFRGLAYGGGSLWVSVQDRQEVYEFDPDTGEHRTFSSDLANGTPGAMTWADGYGDLWWVDFDAGIVVRLEPESGEQTNVDLGFTNPAFPATAGDAVWVADWNSPRVARIDAARARTFRVVDLPGPYEKGDGVWAVAADTDHAWAATPRQSALWEIDAKTNVVTRIPFAFPPAGVTTSGDDVWVAVRARFR